MMTHLINRLEFEVHCPDEGQALNLRHNFSKTLEPQIIQVVEEVCSKFSGDEEWIRIDKIEIDLGSLNSNGPDSEFVEVLKRKFEEQLKEKMSAMPSHEKEVHKQSSEWELLRYYLLNGTLTWWAGATN